MNTYKSRVYKVNPQKNTFSFEDNSLEALRVRSLGISYVEVPVALFWANPRRYPVAGETVVAAMNPENAVLDVRPDGGGE